MYACTFLYYYYRFSNVLSVQIINVCMYVLCILTMQPKNAEGIGVWQDMIDILGVLAVIYNVALVCRMYVCMYACILVWVHLSNKIFYDFYYQSVQWMYVCMCCRCFLRATICRTCSGSSVGPFWCCWYTSCWRSGLPYTHTYYIHTYNTIEEQNFYLLYLCYAGMYWRRALTMSRVRFRCSWIGKYEMVSHHSVHADKYDCLTNLCQLKEE